MNKKHLIWIIPICLIVGVVAGLFILSFGENYLMGEYDLYNCIYNNADAKFDEILSGTQTLSDMINHSPQSGLESVKEIESVPDDTPSSVKRVVDASQEGTETLSVRKPRLSYYEWETGTDTLSDKILQDYYVDVLEVEDVKESIKKFEDYLENSKWIDDLTRRHLKAIIKNIFGKDLI